MYDQEPQPIVPTSAEECYFPAKKNGRGVELENSQAYVMFDGFKYSCEGIQVRVLLSCVCFLVDWELPLVQHLSIDTHKLVLRLHHRCDLILSLICLVRACLSTLTDPHRAGDRA